MRKYDLEVVSNNLTLKFCKHKYKKRRCLALPCVAGIRGPKGNSGTRDAALYSIFHFLSPTFM